MNKIITILVVLFSIQGVLAADPTPPPPTPPPPPGLPIDGGLVVLFFLALVSGYYLSKKYIFIKKGSYKEPFFIFLIRSIDLHTFQLHRILSLLLCQF